MKIITLTLNPAFDIHCYAKQFLAEHENLVKITANEAGGKGVNISRALCRNEVENLALVVLGEENGDAFQRALNADGITHRAVRVPGRIRENMTVHTEGANETRISFEGFCVDSSLLDWVKKELTNEIEEGSVVTFTGRVPDGLAMSDVKDFLRELEALGARIVIDSRSFSIEELLELKPLLIKPNQEEISMYLNRSVKSFDQVIEGAWEFYRKGIANVMVSLGERGALLVCGEGAFVATPPKIRALSTIGAGDSSIAGFLSAATRGENPKECLRCAVAFGTAACMTEGTRPPQKADVDSVYQQITIETL